MCHVQQITFFINQVRLTPPPSPAIQVTETHVKHTRRVTVSLNVSFMYTILVGDFCMETLRKFAQKTHETVKWSHVTREDKKRIFVQI